MSAIISERYNNTSKTSFQSKILLLKYFALDVSFSILSFRDFLTRLKVDAFGEIKTVFEVISTYAPISTHIILNCISMQNVIEI